MKREIINVWGEDTEETGKGVEFRVGFSRRIFFASLFTIEIT